jgi:quercetin dioxygenase-like cupin family protein
MKTLLLTAALLLLGAASIGPAEAADPPRQSALILPQTFENVATPARSFDVLLMVVDFEPGAAAQDSAQSARFFTIMQGQVSVTVAGETDVLTASADYTKVVWSASAAPGLTATITNSGANKARVYVSALVPAWDRGPQFAAQSSSAAATTAYSGSQHFDNMPATMTVRQSAAALDPGYVSGLHMHPAGNHYTMMELTGAVSFEYLDGGSETYVAGPLIGMASERPGVMANRGTTTATTVTTLLQVPGTVTQVNLPAPTAAIRPPSTGGAGLLPRSDAALPGWSYAGALGGALAGGGALLLIRRRARA